MSYPILYSPTEDGFTFNGLGILADCVSCEVTEEANGMFELVLRYPMDGIHYDEITYQSIIKAKADDFRDPQLFRVYAISQPMSGIVTILAAHISYDLTGIPVKPFSAENVADALSGLKENAVVKCPFDFWTDKEDTAKFNSKIPGSIRSKLGGTDDSILGVYSGDFEFDNFTVKLHKSRGENRGVSIRYGKNLTDIQQDHNCSDIATGIYPYWYGDVDGKKVLVELPEKFVNAPGTYDFVKIKTIDVTNNFKTKPSVSKLETWAQFYVLTQSIGVPVVSLTVSFAQLEKYEEYKHLKDLESVRLFDIVNVEFHQLNVSATAMVVKTVYDSINERFVYATIGSIRKNIADTISKQSRDIGRSQAVSMPGWADSEAE